VGAGPGQYGPLGSFRLFLKELIVIDALQDTAGTFLGGEIDVAKALERLKLGTVVTHHDSLGLTPQHIFIASRNEKNKKVG
jgi:hypothetical protein